MSAPILMPALSPTMEEGTLAKWHVKPGDHVSPGDVIAEIETDKATMEVEAVDEGVIGKLLVPEGAEKVKVKTPIAEMMGGDEAPAKVAAEQPKPAVQKAEHQTQEPVAAKAAAAPAQERSAPRDPGSGDRVFASPLARRLASQAGIKLSSVQGSGPHGRIVKADIEAASAASPRKAATPEQKHELATLRPSSPERPANVPYRPGEYTLQPLDGMRKTIARRMTQSFNEVPHFSLTVEVEMERLLEARKQLNARLEHENIKLSINDILIRASALALKKSPEANVSFIDNALLKHKHAHVAVAVAVPGGLMTPVIFQAETKGLAEISREMAALAEKARARKLLPTEYEGGTFTISNLGMYGIKSFTSIINEPQSMILSVGAGEQRPIVKAGAVAIATMVTLTLTCDHRAVDGAIGAEFLAALRGFVEDPMTMML